MSAACARDEERERGEEHALAHAAQHNSESVLVLEMRMAAVEHMLHHILAQDTAAQNTAAEGHSNDTKADGGPMHPNAESENAIPEGEGEIAVVDEHEEESGQPPAVGEESTEAQQPTDELAYREGLRLLFSSPSDATGALQCFRTAAAAGHREGRYWLGHMHYTGAGALNPGRGEALQLWEALAEEGHANAQVRLAAHLLEPYRNGFPLRAAKEVIGDDKRSERAFLRILNCLPHDVQDMRSRRAVFVAVCAVGGLWLAFDNTLRNLAGVIDATVCSVLQYRQATSRARQLLGRAAQGGHPNAAEWLARLDTAASHLRGISIEAASHC
mmetsp:Transcript_18257/g.70550  ORF Transcript_18257/g.70550 Transcript_18257/m.70550 type:complete len:329 (-) Transcript_18257:80-1066(-)